MERVKMIFTCDKCRKQYESKDMEEPYGWHKVEVTNDWIVETFFLCPECYRKIMDKIRSDDRDD